MEFSTRYAEAKRSFAQSSLPSFLSRKLAGDAGLSGGLGHGLGHGVGFDIHEWPRFSKLDKTPCAQGMVITNEPGIYLPAKFGVRIEDMLLVTADGCRSLTKSPKELIEL